MPLVSRFPEIIAAMEGKAQAVVDKTAADVEAHWKEGAPVDTGAYKASVTTRPGRLSAVVYSNQEYAEFLEWGTRKMAAQPSATPAAEAVAPAFVAAMKQIVS